MLKWLKRIFMTQKKEHELICAKDALEISIKVKEENTQKQIKDLIEHIDWKISIAAGAGGQSTYVGNLFIASGKVRNEVIKDLTDRGFWVSEDGFISWEN